MIVDVVDKLGKVVGETELDDSVWGIEPNIQVMHQALLRQLANARLGTRDTKTRGEVAGGGRKPWRQKGTGRARQGSIRSPQWRGGGIVFGPVPRSYSYKLPKKVRRLAIKSALSTKVLEENILVLENLAFETPKTKEFASVLKGLSVEKK